MSKPMIAALSRQLLTLASGFLAAWGVDHAGACDGVTVHAIPASAALLGLSASVAWSVKAHAKE
jgi:hypothetical protein